MGRPKLTNGKSRKVNFMISPDLGDFLKFIAKTTNVTESDLHRHLFASSLNDIVRKALKNDMSEQHKEVLKTMLNNQILPLLNPVLLVGDFNIVNKKR